MNKRVVTALLAAVLVAFLIVPTSAKTEAKTAILTYAGITVSLNGKTINPADAQGNYIEPFIIDGTTYLPLRGVASALGLDVGWEQATHTVKLSTGGVAGTGAASSQATYRTQPVTLQYANIFIKLDGKDVWPHDANGNYVEPFLIGGTVFLPVRGIASALGLDVSWDQSSHTVKLTSEKSAEDLWAPILNATMEQAYQYFKDNMQDARDYWGDRLGEIGYTYHDINGDGMPELLVGFTKDPDRTAVYAIYTISNNHAVCLATGEWPDIGNQPLQVYANGTFAITWINNSTHGDIGSNYYRIKNAGRELIESLVYDYDDDSIWYSTTNEGEYGFIPPETGFRSAGPLFANQLSTKYGNPLTFEFTAWK